MMDLTALKEGCFGRVGCLTARGGMRRRLMDLGLTRGVAVRCLFSAPGGGMRAYQVRGAVIALRARDAKTVFLEGKSHA